MAKSGNFGLGCVFAPLMGVMVLGAIIDGCGKLLYGGADTTPTFTSRRMDTLSPPPPHLQVGSIQKGLWEYVFNKSRHGVKPNFRVKVKGPKDIMLIWYVVKTNLPKSSDDYEGPYKLNEFVSVKSEGYVLVRTPPKKGNLLIPSQGIPVPRNCPLSIEIIKIHKRRKLGSFLPFRK